MGKTTEEQRAGQRVPVEATTAPRLASVERVLAEAAVVAERDRELLERLAK